LFRKFIKEYASISLLIIVILVLMVVLLNAFVSARFISFSNSLFEEKFISNINSLRSYIDDSAANTKAAAVSMAHDVNVIKAIKEHDANKMLMVLLPTHSRYRINYYTVTGIDGNVLIRTHEPQNTGDSVLDQQNIRDALNGKVSTYFEEGTRARVSVRTGAPVYDADGTLLGVISAGMRFDLSSEVEALKKHYKSEITVYLNNTRLVTTITREGQSIAGTTLDPQIAKIVIDNKQEYSGSTTILGEKYRTFYKPLLNPQRTVFAVIFLGMSMEKLEAQIRTSIFTGIFIGLTELLFIFILIHRNLNEKKKLKQLVGNAEAALAVKTEFLSNMSHEIRTPMNAIIGMTSLGLSAVSAERKNHNFRKIKEASRHLLGIVNDILDISSIKDGALALSPAEFSFEKMLRGVVNINKFRIDEKRQKMTVYADHLIPGRLLGDEQRLAQLVTNLLSNAIKFTPENGSIRIETKFIGEEREIVIIQVSVIDTGIGISDEQQKLIFRSFHQAESNTSRKYGGMGLGLAIAKNIVEIMDGKIWVESEPGRGARFIFTVRLKKIPDTKTINPGYGKIRILAADEDMVSLEDIREIMAGFNVSCDTASDGQEALRLLENACPYDICFVDRNMRDATGLQLTEALKEKMTVTGRCFMVIVSSSALSVIEDEVNNPEAGALLSKPLFPSDVADVLSEFFASASLEAPSIEAPSLEAPQPNTDIRQINSDTFEGRHILLVEDIEINCEIMLALLEPVLLEVDRAKNGRDAFDMFAAASDKYDLIFMDMQMPEMDGIEATRRIRALNIPKAKTIPIVALTANVSKQDMENCIKAGMNAHIGKPLDFSEVMEVLRLYL